MVRWLRWHCPPDTGFEIRALAVWGRARYLSVTEAPLNTNFHTWMGKKQFCFFQTAETGNRTPDSGVKGSGANHYPGAPARLIMTPIDKNPINLILVYPQNRITCRMVLLLIYSVTFREVLRVVVKWLDNSGCKISWESPETCLRTDNSVKRSDVTGNPFEWLLGEIMLYKSCPPYFIILASSVIGGQGYWISQKCCVLY